MKASIKISQLTNQTYIPKSLVGSGFQGKVMILSNASVVVLLHPKASFDDIEKGLHLVIEDIQTRKELGMNPNWEC